MTVRLFSRSLAVLCLALLALPVVLLAVSAQAATHVVTLSGDGPSPASITIPRGDTVTFRNADNVQHTVRRTSGPWSFQVTIPAGGTAMTPAFTVASTFGYEDSYSVALLVQRNNGSITATAPKPTATRSSTPKPTPTRTTPAPTRSATPTPSPTGSGIAVGPGIGITTIPPVMPSSGPTPNIAPPVATTTAATTVAYGDKAGLVQSSPHRYGLPMALALVAALGVLSLIVRLLLSLQPPAVPGPGPGSDDLQAER